MNPTDAVPESILRHRTFVLYWSARTCAAMGFQMLGVAVAWQMYALTGSAFDLGLVGLMQFLPAAAFMLVAGQIADRYDRRRLLQICQNRGRPTEEGVEIDFSPREQPTAIGVGEPAIHWMLNRLERSGIIDRSGDQITIRDPAQLQNYLEYLHLQWKFGEI